MSAREWQPGDVAVATVRGVPNVRVMCVEENDPFAWVSASPVEWQGFHEAPEVIDARPLVVIDPEDREAVERLAGFAACTRQQMEYALREFANPTPPKPEEPTGLGAVVEDDEGQAWVRLTDHEGANWHRWNAPDDVRPWRFYDGINAVRVLSEGVTQ